MKKLTGCFLSAVLLLAVLNSVLAENLFFEEGGNVTLLLRPPFSGEIISIAWMHNNDNMAKWMKEDVPLEYHGTFEGRTTLDTTTGSLKIINMSRADSGEYSVNINDKFQDERYNATLIKAVPQPAVLVKPLTCTNASKQCTLTCDGKTKEAEPVTYSWKMGGGEWKDGEKDRSITNDEKTRVKMFSCRMKNPISVKESHPKPNPFFREKVSASSGVGLPVDLFLLVVGILAAVVGAGF
ncbi:CD48 antigen-like [Thunnus thynnus]|uniref:CD48 antigen-like n=1 Tax=Thunnus thynnus TaxID=8237 RepID=UPI003528EFE0